MEGRQRWRPKKKCNLFAKLVINQYSKQFFCVPIFFLIVNFFLNLKNILLSNLYFEYNTFRLFAFSKMSTLFGNPK